MGGYALMITGLTGRSCSGKDAAAAFFIQKGFEVIDVDRLGHEALVANRDRLVSAFGEGILAEDGAVSRRALGNIVFSNSELLEKLNSISHPWMCNRVEELVEGKDLCFINCALLEKMNLVRLCDEILYFWAPLEERVKRAIQRDGITEESFLRREANQKEIGSTLFECGRRVITILNDGDKNYLYRQLEFYYDTLLGRGYAHG